MLKNARLTYEYAICHQSDYKSQDALLRKLMGCDPNDDFSQRRRAVNALNCFIYKSKRFCKTAMNENDDDY